MQSLITRDVIGDHEKLIYEFDCVDVGLYLEPHVSSIAYDFSEGAVLLALCSEVFSEEDYVR